MCVCVYIYIQDRTEQDHSVILFCSVLERRDPPLQLFLRFLPCRSLYYVIVILGFISKIDLILTFIFFLHVDSIL